MKYTDYFFPLCTRFVNDFNLPITVIRDPKNFQYELDFFEPTYKTKSKWIALVDTINREYEGNPDKFLDEYAKARNEAITYIELKPEFIKWNNDIDSLKAWRAIQYPKSIYASVYNQDTIGRQFSAFDMKNANFQALKYAGVLEDDTYPDFLKRFADGGLWEYMKESKYTRQVLFGKCNPNRQVTLEKKIMFEFYEKLKGELHHEAEMAYFGADEFVLVNRERIDEEEAKRLQKLADDLAPVIINTETYDIRGWSFYVIHADGTKHILGNFFHKSSAEPGKFKCMPDNYSKILRKKLAGEEPNDFDRTINYDKCIAIIQDKFEIEELNSVKK